MPALPFLVAALAGGFVGYRASGGINTLTTIAAAAGAAYITYRVTTR